MNQSPLMEMLEGYKNNENISFAMPGHKNGRGIEENLRNHFFSYDITELEQSDSLFQPGDAIQRARESAARFFGAEETYFLVNGSSSGIFTMLMSCCSPGERVLIDRACHVSIINACTALDLEPVFIEQSLLPGFNIPNTAQCDEIKRLLTETDAAAVLVTSPNYFGVTADLASIAKAVYRHKIPLLVDEAHGAHFSAAPEIFPKPAMLCGADMCVQSAHKTLNAGNQTAFLHYKSKLIDPEKVQNSFKLFQTTSPSYPLIASADMARAQLENSGEREWERIQRNCARLRAALRSVVISPDRKLRDDGTVFDIDECRLVLDLSRYEISGYAFAKKLLHEYKIDVEMADLQQVVLIPTPSNTDAEFDLLISAVRNILKDENQVKAKREAPDMPRAAQVMTPSEAFHHKGYRIALEKAEGHISKSTVTPYPPGIPLLHPGELVLRGHIEYITHLLSAGAVIQGLTDGKIEITED